jgi:putative endonuclease
VKEPNSWYVYILRCGDQSLYTGITTDPQRRLRQHRGELKGGARYTRARLPLQMVYLEPQPTRSSASKRESEIKALRVSQKEALILSVTNLEEISY